MTIQEAFVAELDEVAVPAATIQKTLLDRGLNGATTYAPEEYAKDVDLCVIDCLYRMYTRPDVKEGDYSKSHPDIFRKLEARLLFLATKHQVTEVLAVVAPVKAGPTIKDGSAKW
ncbi:DUF6706 family protein [Flaviaesturariibacter amylovorans]|uniref:Uncharacterized protein n=1 Tax=Flaviaesturariibacter amylovorans TaxID=1084520 RepID=A0ABP8GQR6_9BACT